MVSIQCLVVQFLPYMNGQVSNIGITRRLLVYIHDVSDGNIWSKMSHLQSKVKSNVWWWWCYCWGSRDIVKSRGEHLLPVPPNSIQICVVEVKKWVYRVLCKTIVSDCKIWKKKRTRTCRTRVKISHLTTNRHMTSGMNPMICSNRLSFKFDMELLECCQVHDLGYFGRSEVPFVRIVHTADEAMIGN